MAQHSSALSNKSLLQPSPSKHFTDIYVGKSELLDGLSEVVVPLLNFLLSGGEVRAEEDHGGGVVGDADGDGPLVPRGATQPSLDVLNTDISGTRRERDIE